MSEKKNLRPRICRGCGLIFQPETALSRYGSPDCKKIPGTLKMGGRTYGNFRCIAVPAGTKVTHP